jgi:hypothetical protein
MALAEVQAALAKLFTQTQARAAFARDSLAAGRALGLDEADAAALARLAPRALERYAASLTAKRRLDAAKLLPLTALALGDEFGPRSSEAFAEPPPGAVADALALVDRLASDPRAAPPWIGDLARYEGAFLRSRRPRCAIRVHRFHFPVLAIAGALRRGERIDAVPPRRCIGIWARMPGRALRHWVYPIPSL